MLIRTRGNLMPATAALALIQIVTEAPFPVRAQEKGQSNRPIYAFSGSESEGDKISTLLVESDKLRSLGNFEEAVTCAENALAKLDAHPDADPKKSAHPIVNGVPQRRRSPMGGGPIHVNVDEHGSYRAAWSGNWLGRSLGTNVRYRRASNLAGRNVSEA